MTSIEEGAAPTATRWSTIGWLALATLISMIFSGYIPLFSNNVYHLPILFGAYDLPQFEDDAFIQSLRNFSSGFWIIFADTARFVDPKLFLGVWLIITHFLFLGACVHFGRSLGYRDLKFLSAFAIVLALVSLSVGEAAGGGGLIVENFSHSELANASMLMAFSFSVSKRYGFAVYFGCVTFFLNAFMAVWAAGPILAIAAYHLGSRQISFSSLVRTALPGFVGLILVLPVLLGVLGNREGLVATSFSYPDYLLNFYPAHFFISTVGFMPLLEATVLVVASLLTYSAHRQAKVGLLALSFGAAGILLLGIIAPLLVDSRTILNLHLIRSFVMLHMMGELSMVLFALTRAWSPEEKNDRAIGLATTALLFLPRPFWMVVIPVLLFDRFGGRAWKFPQRYQGYLKGSLVLLLLACVAALPFRAYRKFQFTQAVANELAQWERVGEWANLNTASSASFLMSQKDNQAALLGFSYAAARQVWFDFKYGAAVMWAPSYYETWKTREDAVASLSDLASMRSYAVTEGIDYIASPCLPNYSAVFRYERLCVYDGAPKVK